MSTTISIAGLKAISRGGLLAMVFAGLVAPAVAERREAGGDDASRKAQYMLRQMQAELQKVKAENAKLKGELDGMKKSRNELEGKLENSEKKLSSSNNRNASLNSRLREDGDKYRDLADRYRDLQTELRQARFKAGFLEDAVAERNEWIDVCQKQNDELYTVNNELLDAYRDKGVMASFSQTVPVTGLARVRVENLVEDYRYKLDDLKMFEFADSTREEYGLQTGQHGMQGSTGG